MSTRSPCNLTCLAVCTFPKECISIYVTDIFDAGARRGQARLSLVCSRGVLSAPKAARAPPKVTDPVELHEGGSLAEHELPERDRSAPAEAALRALPWLPPTASSACFAAAISRSEPHCVVLATPAGHPRGARPARRAVHGLPPRADRQVSSSCRAARGAPAAPKRALAAAAIPARAPP